MTARGAFFGITASVQPQHLVRAVLEAIAYQVLEVVQAINASSIHPMQRLIVDGGACENNFLMQFQADVLGIPVERPTMRDTTVQGAAFAAGLAIGFWDSYAELVKQRKIDRIFEPGEGRHQATANFVTWQKAVKRTLEWEE
jgi:glycerol kinase